MDKGTVLEALRFMEHCLEAKGLNISKLILFGSHARSGATAESDIDIVVLAPVLWTHRRVNVIN